MRSFVNIPVRRLVAGAAVLAVVSTAAACGGESGSTKASGSTDDPVAQAAAEKLDGLYGEGTFTLPPDSGPKAQKGYRVAVVSSGTQSPTGTSQGKAAKEVAELLDWDLTVYDGKYEPSEYQEGIRQAISAKADVIWLYSIDCPLVKTALDEAKRARIPVVSQEGADCSDVTPGADTYFARTMQFTEGNFIKWGEALGAAQATWLLAKLGKDANIIEVSVSELIITKTVHDGFQKAMAEQCPDCKVTNVPVRIADFGPALQEKISTALLRNPQANGLAVSYDDLMTAGGAAAVMASGRNDSLEVTSGSGYAANADLVRKNQGQDSGWTYDGRFETWGAADMVNRLLADEEPAASGVGVSVFDRDNNLPAEGEAFATTVDYVPVFKKVWGVS